MSEVRLIIEGHIATLHLDNPSKLNAFTAAMLKQLDEHVSALDRNPEVLGVMLTAAGEKAFCAGADILAWGALSPAEFARHWVRDGHRIFDRLARLAKPTVAVLQGHAFGGGLELAAACDIRVMAPKATIALPEPAVGIVPGWSGTQRLTRLLPEAVLKEMLLFSRRITAERALQLGFVAEVADDPKAAAQAILARLAELSPRAIETAKYMLHAACDEDRAAMIETLASSSIAASADRDEGVSAFRDKRKPKFSGT
jgi:enoyl-CoA hydratase/carnithine racemase